MIRVLNLYFFSAVCLLFLSGCPQSHKASDEIDSGSFEGNLYRNDFFGFELSIPESWEVQEKEFQMRLLQVGTEIMAGDDHRKKDHFLKLVDLQVVPLMTAFRYPLGTVPNPSLISIAERISGSLPPIRSGRDYHQHSKETLRSGAVQVEFPKEIYTEILGGVSFDVLEVVLTIEGMQVQQKQYVTIDKGYALCFILSFQEDKEMAELQATLKGLSFH